ncbi:S9 family peptidase [Sphingobacterium alkalisoli]|uniref:S9 family peptidase n=1 Tax=Sphingobacterium alkalisoli TaxID=1874115 RepID=A0A4U0H6D2_9SPHI|nr:DPP IV N-terminal domain-containing protein [Sphingobacterium alkalisoli]TJY66834.1 S9 family peptidase [Sphingobacterium alkalisoli]GGH13948.1 prolyl tripeptidyl peptidase [Sphingobacterium alkalisoli]
MNKFFLILLLLGSTYSYAQRNFTIDETVFGPGKFSPKTLTAMKWMRIEDAFTHLDSTYQNLVVRSAKENWSPQNLVTVNQLQSAVNSVLPNEKIELKYIPFDYSWTGDQLLSFATQAANNSYVIEYNIKSQKATVKSSVPSNVSNTEYGNDSDRTAYLVGSNIEIIDANGRKIQVTKDTVDGIVNGSDYTHRQEFGINKGMWWSPDNQKLLYYRKDETMVSKYPLPQWDSRVATIKDIRYPMAGMKSEEVTLVVFNIEKNQYITLQTGEPKEQYLTIATWDPTGQFIYVGVLNRGQDHLKLNQYNANTGAFVKTLFEEKSSTWIEPQKPLTFLPNNTQQFLYQTDKDGYNQLFLYNTEGKLIRHLGHQNIIVTDLKGFDAKHQKAYYVGASKNGMERHLFEVELKSGKTTQLTTTNGVHNASVSPTGSFILDQYSNLTTPNIVQIVRTKDKKKLTITEATNPFTGKINQPHIEFKEFIASDGSTPLNARITYPLNFDKAKKYPVMVYLYGGSHAQLITDRWLGGVGYFDLYMAQNGYLVFTLDNRGSDARGRDFTRITHRNLGEVEMDDQSKGIEYLKSLPYVDTDNMGIFGWSYGGYMATSFMTKHNETFKAAVAGGPVIDWKYYEVMYGERYMDTPQENPEGYKKTSLLDKVDRLRGNLLIIHGAQDPVVVQQHSMDFLEKCIKAGKQVDYFLYPKHEHNVGGQDRIHLYQKIATYFNLHLK